MSLESRFCRLATNLKSLGTSLTTFILFATLSMRCGPFFGDCCTALGLLCSGYMLIVPQTRHHPARLHCSGWHHPLVDNLPHYDLHFFLRMTVDACLIKELHLTACDTHTCPSVFQHSHCRCKKEIQYATSHLCLCIMSCMQIDTHPAWDPPPGLGATTPPIAKTSTGGIGQISAVAKGHHNDIWIFHRGGCTIHAKTDCTYVQLSVSLLEHMTCGMDVPSALKAKGSLHSITSLGHCHLLAQKCSS